MASRPRWLVRGSLRAGSVVGPLGPDRGFSAGVDILLRWDTFFPDIFEFLPPFYIDYN